jgi:pyruvate ferredoxin oxidoreductase beta subunit
MEDGRITSVRRISKKIPVADYLRAQKRFAHLFSGDLGKEEIDRIQALADANIKKYGLLKKSGAKEATPRDS